MARQGELAWHGAVLHVPEAGEQTPASGANGKQLGAGTSPGPVAHWPALDRLGTGTALLLEHANVATSAPSATAETPKPIQVLFIPASRAAQPSTVERQPGSESSPPWSTRRANALMRAPRSARVSDSKRDGPMPSTQKLPSDAAKYSALRRAPGVTSPRAAR
jgi:hypothetical protein